MVVALVGSKAGLDSCGSSAKIFRDRQLFPASLFLLLFNSLEKFLKIFFRPKLAIAFIASFRVYKNDADNSVTRFVESTDEETKKGPI